MRRFLASLVGLLCLLVFPPLASAAQPSDSGKRESIWGDTLSHSRDSSLSFVFTGDIMQHQAQIKAASRPRGRYDYRESFRLIAPYLQDADYTMGNLELTLGGKPYRGYPCFSAPDTLTHFLRAAGFDVLSTATNHSCDRRTKGVLRTISQLDSAHLLHTGTFNGESARRLRTPLMLQKHVGGLKVAVLSYTYGTNGIKAKLPAVVNLIDTAQMASDIARAKKRAEAIIVAVHWGVEYTHKPTQEQRRLADFLFRQGVSVIVGNHPHVIQPFEVRRDSLGRIRQLCVYALGNFISAQRTFPRAGGMVLRLRLTRMDGGVGIELPQYLLTYVQKPSENHTRTFRVVPLVENERPLRNGASYASRYYRRAVHTLRRTPHGVEPLRDLPAARLAPVRPN